VELPLEQRPVASLTPSADGHWLTLKIENLAVEAASLDYQLLYNLPDGRAQGVPGTVQLAGMKTVERKLLMGSESSGKFRYDEGVKDGSLTLRFRDEKGKLITKLATQFALLSKTKTLTSVDENFSYNLTSTNTKDFFVVMETFGVSATPPVAITAGPIGVFSSATVPVAGTVDLSGSTLYRGTASGWTKLTSGKATDIGVFIATD
jgi:hypothetical protein